MHPIARVLAVAYLALAVFAGVVYVGASGNYIDVTQIVLNLPDSVGVTGVDLLWTGSPADPATLRVRVSIENPGRIPIELVGVEMVLHMDNPDDLRAWFEAAKLETTRLRPGGFSLTRGSGIVVAAGETRVVFANVTVEPGTAQMDRLDRPDADGRYHPIAWSPRIVYTFVDFNLQVPVALGPYYDAQGVLPSG